MHNIKKIIREFKKHQKNRDRVLSTKPVVDLDCYYNNNNCYLDLNGGMPAMILFEYDSNISITKASRKGWITIARDGSIVMININKDKEEKINHSRPFLYYTGTPTSNTFKSIRIFNIDGSFLIDKPENKSQDIVNMSKDNEVFSTSDSTFDYSDNEFRVTKKINNKNQYYVDFSKKTTEEGLIGLNLFTKGGLFKYKKNNTDFSGYFNISEDAENKIEFTGSSKKVKLEPSSKDIFTILKNKYRNGI
jgi:hypothetical protein|tara:strand:- start:1489 stop:2232 length:744 start_codon:yes stop_codon:yes gene_type:complete